jgi:hypothetical protein
LIGRSPVGEWELSFDDPPSGETRARDRFAREEIESLLVVLTISGELVS